MMKNEGNTIKGNKEKQCSLQDNTIFDALCDLVPFLRFKKREKYPRKNVNFSKVAGMVSACNFTKINTPP